MRIRSLVLSLARALDPFWSARVQLSSQVKTASRQEAGGNQINFNANLPASCRPQSSRLTTLFRSQVRALLASGRRSERKTSELKCENNRFNRAGFHRTATVYRAIFSIFQYFAILLTTRSASVVLDMRYFQILQTENNIYLSHIITF